MGAGYLGSNPQIPTLLAFLCCRVCSFLSSCCYVAAMFLFFSGLLSFLSLMCPILVEYDSTFVFFVGPSCRLKCSLACQGVQKKVDSAPRDSGALRSADGGLALRRASRLPRGALLRAPRFLRALWGTLLGALETFGDRDRGGVETYRTLEGGELASKLAPRRLGLLTPKLTIFYRISVERGQFQGPLEIENLQPPL